jgi:archaellum biogenesis protein FlaJ (TadC family)
MERQLLEAFALCSALLNESDKSLNPTLVIVMFTLIHNFHFFLMVKYVPKEYWPEKLLLLGAEYGPKK